MSKKSGGGKSSHTLPEEVRNLIIRKLRHRRRELEKSLVDVTGTAYSKLREEILTYLRAQKPERALKPFNPSIGVYSECVASVRAITKEWPGIVWETIATTLEKAHVALHDGLELNSIVDEFTWVIGQNPFTLGCIDPERSKGSVFRAARAYGGIDVSLLFNLQLESAATSAQIHILDTAKQAREGIGIAIDKYVVAQRQGEQMGYLENEENVPVRTTELPPSNTTGGANSKLPGHLNHDIQMQQRANDIAAKLTISDRKPTKEKVAKQLATELDQVFETVLRRIRKQW